MKHLLTLPALLTLCACGAGGSSFSNDNSVKNAPVGGIYKGQIPTASGAPVTTFMLVTEDGKYFSAAENFADNCADVAMGSIASAGSTFSGSGDFGLINFTTVPSVQIDCGFADSSVWGTAMLTGSIDAGSSLTITSTDATSLGMSLPSITGTLTFDALYNESSSLSKVAGNWTTQTGAVIRIDATGVIIEDDPQTGCVVNGQVSMIDSTYNAYSASVTYSSCGDDTAVLDGLSAKGLITLDDTVVPNVLYLAYSLTLPLGDVLIVVSEGVN